MKGFIVSIGFNVAAADVVFVVVADVVFVVVADVVVAFVVVVVSSVGLVGKSVAG